MIKKFNFIKKYVRNYTDEYGMVLQHSCHKNKCTKDHSIGDSIGDTSTCYLVYEDKRFLDVIKRCYVYRKDDKGEYIEAYRHPKLISTENYINDMSRDHIIGTLAIMNYAGDITFIKELSKKLRWKISSKHKFTLDMWLWMKGIAGNKLAMFAYYLLEIPLMYCNLKYNSILYKIAKISPEKKQDEYKNISDNDRTYLQRLALKIHYPFYAFCFSALINYTNKDSLGKRLLNKVYSKFVPTENIYMKLLCNMNVTKDEVYNYKSMTSNRWTTILNEICDRDVRIITNPDVLEDNVLDVDVIRKLYELSLNKK